MNNLAAAVRKPLDPKLMKELAAYVNDLSAEERRDWTIRGLRLIELLKHRFRDDFECATTIASFQGRMEALARLRDHPNSRAWTLKFGTAPMEPDLIHEVLLEAAAEAPLLECEDRAVFDPEEFFRIALEKAETPGRA